MIRRKKKNSNKTSSNIILSAVNPTSCYDTKDECDVDCRGYRCSDNCNRSSTQCQEGETGCYGSEETCKSSCTPVYRCSVSGVVKEYKACAGESGCYPGESQANANCVKTYSCDSTNGCIANNTFGPLCATGTNCYNSQSACSTNCVKTYSCAGSGPTGMTGCNLSNTFGPPCASGATNCYDILTSCTEACKGYRCSTNCAAGAKCGDSEPNCYPTSAACSTGAGSCPNVYRCDDNCIASRTPCGTGEVGKCFTTQNDCQRLCQATYRCTPDKKCVQEYTPCLPADSNTCFKGQPTCFSSTGPSCQKGYRCTSKCAESTMCIPNETGCHDTLQLCIDNCTGYRCNVNCEQGKGCTASETCYLTAAECKTTCPAYRCGVGNNGYGCYASESKCSESEVGSSCFTVNNCLNTCSQFTVFTRIANNEPDMKYKIVNVANNKQISGGNSKDTWVNVIYNPDNDNFNPDQFWTFKNADYTTFPNLSAFIINSSDKQLVCLSGNGNDTLANNSVDQCGDGVYNDVGGPTWHRIIILPSSDATERLNGICYLVSTHHINYIYQNGRFISYYGTFISLNSDNRLKVGPTKDATSKWKIVPYKNGARIW